MAEKPKTPKSPFAQTGLYVYGKGVVSRARKLKPSHRGEYEITDLNNQYLKEGKLSAEVVTGEWIDAGTFESLYKASSIVREHRLDKRLEVKDVKIKAVKKQDLPIS